MFSCNDFSKRNNVSMSALSHCRIRRIVSKAFNTCLFFGGVMRIKLAALTDNCEVHVQICARTLLKNLLQDQRILQSSFANIKDAF